MKRLLAFAALAVARPALAQSADLAAIDVEVARFTGSPVGAPGGAAQPVDRRLRLRLCPGPLALDWYGLRRETVQVSCPVPDGWRIYVPLTAGSQHEQAAPLVTKGDAVTVTVSGQGFAVSQQGEALEGGGVGEWIKVRLGRGEPLRARVLRPGAVGIVLP